MLGIFSILSKNINNIEILIKGLLDLNIEAFTSERSDLKVNFDGIKKISGSAFKQKKESSVHHGTMLINTELNKLNNYLKSKHSYAILLKSFIVFSGFLNIFLVVTDIFS